MLRLLISYNVLQKKLALKTIFCTKCSQYDEEIQEITKSSEKMLLIIWLLLNKKLESNPISRFKILQFIIKIFPCFAFQRDYRSLLRNEWCIIHWGNIEILLREKSEWMLQVVEGGLSRLPEVSINPAAYNVQHGFIIRFLGRNAWKASKFALNCSRTAPMEKMFSHHL